MSETYTSDNFQRACRGEPVDHTPVWLMRQAGRYLPEYRAIRANVSFRELLERPELAVEVTLQPTRRYDLDAAIIFADILTVTEAMGVPFEIVSGVGPVMARTIRTEADIASLHTVEPEADLQPHLEAVRMVVRELSGRIPLIGFSGAPFTLACYIVEGGPSKNFTFVRRLFYQEPELAHRLLDSIAQSVTRLLAAQIDAGVEAVQLFDTWASVLGADIYREFAAPAVNTVLNALADKGVPRIIYVGNTEGHLDALSAMSAEVVSADWRVPLSRVKSALGPDVILQGNLDPCALYAPPQRLETEVEAVLREAAGLRGHIFNLGHGINKDVDPDQVGRVIDAVHDKTAKTGL